MIYDSVIEQHNKGNEMNVFTIWDFFDLHGNRNRVVRIAEPNDRAVQHEYQKVVAQVVVDTKEKALRLAA